MYLNNLNIIKIIPKLSNKKPTSNHFNLLVKPLLQSTSRRGSHPPDLVVPNDSFFQKYTTDTNYSRLIVQWKRTL